MSDCRAQHDGEGRPSLGRRYPWRKQPGIGTREPMNKQPGIGTREPMKKTARVGTKDPWQKEHSQQQAWQEQSQQQAWEEQSQQQAKKSTANSRHQKSTASRPEHHVAVPQRADAEDLDGCTAPGSLCTKTWWRIHRTVQEAEKYRDENEAKQGEDSGHEWLGEPSLYDAKHPRDAMTTQSQSVAERARVRLPEAEAEGASPEQRRRCRTQFSSSRQLRRHWVAARASESHAAKGVSMSHVHIQQPTQQSVPHSPPQQQPTGLALCHDVTLDIVTHRWVPVDTHSTPVPERGRLWVAQHKQHNSRCA